MHTVRTASRHPVCRVAFSPCGGYFATAQPHHGVTLHDRAGGEAVRTLYQSRRPDYTSLRFLRGGGWLAAAGTKGLVVVDPSSGELVGACAHAFASGLRLGCRGDVVLAGGRLSVLELLIDPDTREIDRAGYWHSANTLYHEVAPGGDWSVAFRAGGSPVAVDLTARRVALALAHPARVEPADALTDRNIPAVAFTGSAPRAAIGDGKTVTVFDLATARADGATVVPAPTPVGAAAFTLPPPDGWPAGRTWRPPFALTPDGRGLLVKRPRERVQLWDVDGGTLAAEWGWRLEGITCLAVAPDGLTAVAGGRFGRVLVWDLA